MDNHIILINMTETIISNGIPLIKDYEQLIRSEFFSDMEKFSNKFLKENKSFLEGYSRKWVRDTLHQWGRQWEYPFVLRNILNNKKDKLKILDAGSGVTFFPYYVNSLNKNVEIVCCDYDDSLERVFSNINSNFNVNVKFTCSDIRNMPYEDNSFDIIYCISVLEHTKDYEKIIKEFKRLLKKEGRLIITFDLALDGFSDIPIKEAQELLDKLYEYFPKKQISSVNISKLLSEEIITTRYIKKNYNKNLLPWRYPLLSTSKAIINRVIKLKMPRSIYKNITCYGEVFENGN